VALNINQIKNGLTILLDKEVYQVIEYQHVKPGKGAAFVRTKLRNLASDTVIEKTFKGDEKLQEAFVEERRLQYLYRRGDTYFFLDQDNFEEISIGEEKLNQREQFLKDNLQITAHSYKGDILSIGLPNFVNYRIIHTEPGIKGDTAKGASKPARLETGLNIQVPLFIEIGDLVKVDTRSGQYVERVNSQ
jgi:elongation factor P